MAATSPLCAAGHPQAAAWCVSFGHELGSLTSSIFQIPSNGKPLFTLPSGFGQVSGFLE
jgi:hypothetical protein